MDNVEETAPAVEPLRVEVIVTEARLTVTADGTLYAVELRREPHAGVVVLRTSAGTVAMWKRAADGGITEHVVRGEPGSRAEALVGALVARCRGLADAMLHGRPLAQGPVPA